MNYCFQCMAKLDRDGKICPVCGYDNSVTTNGIGFLPPCTLNKQYIVGKALGRGGFGITYIGLDIDLDRKVAIKEYFPMSLVIRDPNTQKLYPIDSSAEDDFRRGIERVHKEAKVAVSLESIPNVVRTFGVLDENNTVYIIMEYIEGLTLTKYVQKEGGKLTWLQAWPLLQPIMAALGSIHSHGVVHRDISPDNIMIRRNGKPVLLDFGAAQNISSGNTTHSVSLRMGYAPLEQFSATGPRDGRSDQYSMMATLYYVLTGKEPDSCMSMEEMPGLRATGSDIPESAEKVLMKGMSRMMEDRYPTMEELIEAFERANSNEGTKIVSENLESHPTEISRPAVKNPSSGEGGDTKSTVKTGQEVKSAPAAGEGDKKRKTSKLILGIALAAIIVLLGGALWSGYQKNAANVRNYELYADALEHISAGRYEEAVEILTGLGDFEDAVHQIEIAEKGLEERNAASYAEARRLAENGSYAEALAIFESLGNYSDAAQQAAVMHKYMNLQKADALMEQGEYEQALEIYQSLGDFDSAEEKKKAAEEALEERRNAAAYAEAQAFEQAGRYDEAQKAYAALGTYRDAEEKAEGLLRYIRITEYKTVGNIVTFGRYEQDADTANGMEPIEWMVLEVQDGKALLLSRYALDAKAYNGSTWENSDLRQWLNGDFLQTAFTTDEQSAILTVKVDNSISQGYQDKNGGNDTRDQIFLLSYMEANRYLDVSGEKNTKAQCVPTRYAQEQNIYTIRYAIGTICSWGLRSRFECVLPNGSRGYGSEYNYTVGTRPAFWLNLESDIF